MTCYKKNSRWTQVERIERAHRVGEKSNDKERAIVVQFSFYKDKINILRNCKKLNGTKISIFGVFPKRQCKFVKKYGRRYYLTQK